MLPVKHSFCLFISGNPASGKTTLGNYIARQLCLPLIDKDDFLVSLFETKGIGDNTWRQTLSREADLDFIKAAQQTKSAVLVSHWRAEDGQSLSGTPTVWLQKHFEQVIEIYCHCPNRITAQRFHERKRHAGHLDYLKDLAQLEQWFENYSQYLPLNISGLITVDTENLAYQRTLISKINALLVNASYIEK
ncbi:MAG: shikimate kinase [Oceanospirillaceae bacterium]